MTTARGLFIETSKIEVLELKSGVTMFVILKVENAHSLAEGWHGGK